MRFFLRHQMAALLVFVYALGMAMPFVPLASGLLANGRTIACAGDCRLCGCAPARSNSHTCCCWLGKKKAEQDHAHESHLPDCCAGEKGPSAVVVCSSAPCGLKDEPLQSAVSDPSLAPCAPKRPRVFFLEDDLSLSSHNRPADPYRDPPDHPPETAIRS